MTREDPQTQPKTRGSRGFSGEDRGSALVMAILVLVMLTGMGTALLFMSQNEMKMNQADLRSKRAFYLAEAGLEDARIALWTVNGNGDFSDDLLSAAGGTADDIEFDPATVTVTRDADGRPTGFGGYGDDVPVVGFTSFDDGAYIAFLTNDPGETAGIGGRTATTDSNDAIMLTSIGAGTDNSLEIVQAVLDFGTLVPGVPPATITMLGPTPNFESGTSKVKTYSGDDCGGSGPGPSMPIVGAIGAAAVANAATGIETNPTFESGGETDADTFEDLTDPTETLVSNTGPIDSTWTECENWHQIIETLRLMADVICPDGTELYNTCIPPADDVQRIVFGDGDLQIPPGNHHGTLVVVGQLVMNGNASWTGLILAVGEGDYEVNGAGNGVVSGGVIVADIAGPDNIYGNDDDCTGPDDGFGQGSFTENGGGNAGTIYCSTSLEASWPVPPYEIREFLQR